jgi:hypothetical protein
MQVPSANDLRTLSCRRPNGALTKFQPSGLVQQSAAPTVVAITFAAAASSRDPTLSTKMMGLAEDGAMFTIARFEKQFPA